MASGFNPLLDSLNRMVIGDHLALIYESREEQFGAVAPFILLGLGRSEKCIYIASDNSPKELRQALSAQNIDVKNEEKTGSLVILSPRETYLKGGSFNADGIMEFLKLQVEKARSSGFSALRIIVEMSWSLDLPQGDERLKEYENKLNIFLTQNNAIALCQYSKKRFSAEQLIEVLHTHARVIYGNEVCRNPYYAPPEEIPEPNKAERELDRLLSMMLIREHIQQELRHKNELLEDAVNRLEIDYSSLKESKEDLQRMEEILWVTLGALPVGVWVINQAGELIYGNEAGQQIWGGARLGRLDEISGEYKAYHLDSGQRIEGSEWAAFKALGRGEKILNEELEIETFEGQHKIILHSALPLRNSQQEITGAILVNEDITERKAAEKELKKLNRTLKTLSACNEALVRATEEVHLLNEICQNIVQLGEYYFAWVGFAMDDEEKSILPLAWSGHEEGFLEVAKFSWGVAQELSTPTGEAIRTGERQVTEDIQKDGCSSLFCQEAKKRGYGSSLALPLLADGKPYGALTLYRELPSAFDSEEIKLLQELASDLSYGIVALRNQRERVKAEEALISSNRRLEETLEELKTTQQKLIQQERLTALGRMASGIAHDFNNAISPIMGFAELLLYKPEYLANPQKVKEYVSMIRTAAMDASQVVQHMREFYRKREVGEIFTPVNLSELVKETLQLTEPRWKHQMEARGINIGIKKELAEIHPIMGNQAELREALTNLIFNAVDAMSKGGTLGFRLHAEENAAILEVSDTGEGMTEEVKNHCFEPFYTTKGTKGTGLGLSMVYGIIKRHEGSISVESAPGQGTRFILSFPLTKEFRTEEIHPETREKITHPRKILVVDDEPLVLAMIKEYLVSGGHRVTTATNGKEGLEKILETPFDLLITDLAMPEMTGDQLAEAAKQHNPRLPVIMVTGFADMLEQTPSGVDILLKKPLSYSAIVEAIGQLFSDKDLPETR